MPTDDLITAGDEPRKREKKEPIEASNLIEENSLCGERIENSDGNTVEEEWILLTYGS